MWKSWLSPVCFFATIDIVHRAHGNHQLPNCRECRTVEHVVARVVLNKPKYEYSLPNFTELLRSLHWLPMALTIDYRLASLALIYWKLFSCVCVERGGGCKTTTRCITASRKLPTIPACFRGKTERKSIINVRRLVMSKIKYGGH